MTTLLRRIILEKRAIVLPLVIALAANVFAYVLVVRPLEVKSAGAADRARQSAAALAAAEKDLAAARALVGGKSDADQELSSFYQKVLPTDLTTARRLTYSSLPELARKTGVRYQARTASNEEAERDAKLGHMKLTMVLQGDYRNIRQFIYELESAPNFVIIDDLTIMEKSAGEAQTLTLNMSTYFRDTGKADAR
jgi:Tfp pilus assembly protein PilO